MKPTYWKGLYLLFSVKNGSHWNNQRFDESCEMRRNTETTETEKHKQVFFLNSCCVMAFYEFLCRSVFFCTGHFDLVPLNLTYMYLHCLQQSFFEHIFNFFWHNPADKFDDVFSLKILFLVWLTPHLQFFCSFATLVELFKICESSSYSIKSFRELRGTLNKRLHAPSNV